MNVKNASLAGFAFVLIGAVPALAQQAAVKTIPTPGCTSTPEQLAATKKAALDELHTPGEAKFAFIDRSYIQHNPARIKQAAEDKLSDYDELHKAFVPAPGARPAAAPAAGSQPPPGGTTEIVTVECDIVTVVRNAYRQDPTAPPGTFYEAFVFDTFRIKNGKVVEHWDQNLINPPATAGRGR
jgi:predicted SnoaL-like aldol condensation-catalyzing enzyme